VLVYLNEDWDESYGDCLEVGDASTHWREHGEQHGLARKARFGLFKFFMQTSRAFSLLAHLSNPDQGAGWWKNRQERLKQDAAEGR
jgi:hypothetical protein